MPKPSSGRKRKGVEIPFANSIKEANELAVQYGLAEKADFAGLSLIAANEMIQQLNATRNDYPNAFDKLRFVGSHEAYNKDRLKKVNIKKATLGYSVPYPFAALVMNDAVFNSKEYKKTLTRLKKNVKNRFHPIGCNTLKSVIDHEIGHLINRKYDISHQNKVVHSLFWKYQGKTADKMMNVLSKYANKNISEFVSEAWSEYRNNPQPREVAKAVGHEIIKLMKKK